MANVAFLQVPVEVGLELCTIVGLDDEYPGASLIVMGAHTPSARGRIGRVSADVIAESAIPVLMVRGVPTVVTTVRHRELNYDFVPAAS